MDKIDVYRLMLEIIAELTGEEVADINDPKMPLLGAIASVGSTGISYILDTIELDERVDSDVINKAKEVKAHPDRFINHETTIGELASVLSGASSALTSRPPAPGEKDNAFAADGSKPLVSNRPEVNLDGIRWSRAE